MGLDMVLEWIQGIDHTILEWIAAHLRCGFLDAVLPALSLSGDLGILWIVIALVILFWKKDKRTALMVLIALLITAILGDGFLKLVVARPRPFYQFPEMELLIPPPSGYSFPSGHSASSFAAAIVILLWNRKAGIVALALAALMAFSRLYLYVHYPSDVLVGTVIGICVGFFTVWAFRKVEILWKAKHPNTTP